MATDEKPAHPYIPELCEQFRKGEVDRREFLRTATLLGVSASAAYAFVGTVTGGSPVPQAQAMKKGGDLKFSTGEVINVDGGFHLRTL